MRLVWVAPWGRGGGLEALEIAVGKWAVVVSLASALTRVAAATLA